MDHVFAHARFFQEAFHYVSFEAVQVDQIDQIKPCLMQVLQRICAEVCCVCMRVCAVCVLVFMFDVWMHA